MLQQKAHAYLTLDQVHNQWNTLTHWFEFRVKGTVTNHANSMHVQQYYLNKTLNQQASLVDL